MQEALRYLETSLNGFRLTELLSSSASALVFRGESLTLPNPVVVAKILMASPLETPEQGAAFLQHCETLKHLRHSHLLPLIDAGIDTRHGEQRPYFITAYAGGSSLSRRLSEQERHLLPQDFVLSVLAQTGQALIYLHQQGQTHGNLKPQNVLFDQQEEVQLTDFAQMILAQPRKFERASSGSYEAPELQDGVKATLASDQYALGCLAYELFTGQPPFAIISPKMNGKVYRTRKLIPPRRHNPTVSKQIEDAILKALAADPQQRYESIEAFLQALRVPGFQAGTTKIEEQDTQENPPLIALIEGDSAASEAVVLPSSTGSVAMAAAVGMAARPVRFPARQTPLARSATAGRGRLPLVLVSLLLTLGLAATLFLTLALPALRMAQNGVTMQTGANGHTPTASLARTPTPAPGLKTPRQPEPGSTYPAQVAQPIPSPTKQPTPVTKVTPTPTTPAIAACAVKATKTNQWSNGFTMNVKIINTGTKMIDGWNLAWHAYSGQTIMQVWNATGRQFEQAVVLSNVSWDGDIAPGQSATPGLNVSFRFSDDLPTKFTLNGIECQ